MSRTNGTCHICGTEEELSYNIEEVHYECSACTRNERLIVKLDELIQELKKKTNE
jgi:hypothetical protein